MPKYINPTDLPESWVNTVKANNYELDVTDLSQISVTTLKMPPKMRLLTARHWDNIIIDVSKKSSSSAVFGTSVHSALSKANDGYGAYTTMERIKTQILGKRFSGEPDFYRSASSEIEDYKFTSVWTWMFGKEDFEAQTNSYAWLETAIKKREVNRLLIVLLFKDWRKSELFKYKDYPQKDIMKWYPRLWSREEQYKYIVSRIHEHMIWEDTEDDEIPICTRKERWADPNVFAVYPKGKRTRAYRVFEKEADANELVSRSPKDKYEVIERKAIDKRCIEWCNCNIFCNYYQETYGD